MDQPEEPNNQTEQLLKKKGAKTEGEHVAAAKEKCVFWNVKATVRVFCTNNNN